MKASARLDPSIAARLLAATLEREMDRVWPLSGGIGAGDCGESVGAAEARICICRQPAQVSRERLAALETNFNNDHFGWNALVEVSAAVGAGGGRADARGRLGQQNGLYIAAILWWTDCRSASRPG